MKALLGILLIFAVGCGQALDIKNGAMKRKPNHPVKPEPKPDPEPSEPIDLDPAIEETAIIWFEPGDPFRDGNTIRLIVHQESRGESPPLRAENLNITLGHDPNVTLTDQQDAALDCNSDAPATISWMTFEVEGSGSLWIESVSADFCENDYNFLTLLPIVLTEQGFVVE